MDGSSLPGCSRDEPARFECQDHLMYGWRRDSKVVLHFGLRGRASVDFAVVIDEGQVLAVAAYEKSIELKPGQLHALAYLGDAYLQLGRLEEAREILTHTSGVSLDDPKFQYFLAELYLKLGMMGRGKPRT